MNFSTEQIEALTANLDGSIVKERAGFSYIEGWHAVKEANRIFGHGNWTHQIIDLKPWNQTAQGKPNYTGSTGRDGYLISFFAIVRVTVGDQFHDGVGYGEGIDYSNCGQALESAVKEAETDAMKRALKNWGNPFGLALYDKDQAQVDRAPSDKGHGICPEHGVPYNQSDKQRELGYPPSHKQGDTWCSKKTVVQDTPATGWQTDYYREATQALNALFNPGQATANTRANYAADVIGRDVRTVEDLRSVTDEEWSKVKQAAVDDLASAGTIPEGDPAAAPPETDDTEQLDF